MKKEKAITLIALIITIIILVILAAVSIRAVYNMGIVNHAINGTQEYAKATKAEEKTMNDTENFLSSIIAKIKDDENGDTEDESIYENMQWTYAWVCNNDTWSNVTQGQNESELTGQVFAKVYEMENSTYHLIIDPINGGGEMGHVMMTFPNEGFAWKKDIDCTKLTKVIIHEGVQSVGVGAFYFCTGLTNITIPSSVTSIGNYAFYNCTGLTNITIPNLVTSIMNSAFSYCTGLTNITIPSSVTSIENYAFSYCTGLTNINVESGNTKYDSRNNCNAIIETANNKLLFGCKNTTIPSSVTSIGNYAFAYCTGLTNITIPSSVTSIGASAFRNCSALTNITIPSSVTSIGNSAFSSCTGLTNITIPNLVTSIGNSAFYDCTGLTNITIPSSVTSIGNSAFSTCTSLTNVTIDSSTIAGGLENTDSNGRLINYATTVYIKSDITTIGSKITSDYTKQGTSDKTGYDKYVRNY